VWRTIWIVGAAVVVVGAMAGAAWWNGRISTDPGSLLKRLPTQDAAVVGIDFAALRRGGLLDWLNRSKTPEDAEYVAFVRETGFDYKRDLDSVLVSFAPDGEFFLVKGTFNWPRLEAYAIQQKGSCFDHLCRVAGSTPERHISFFPLKHNLMAMSVAPDDTAAARMQNLGPQSDVEVQRSPVWMTLSAGALRGSRRLPDETRLLASAVTEANRVTLTAEPAADGFEARLDAVCRDAEQAGTLTGQLQILTNRLREGAKQSAQPDSNGLATLLMGGTFEQAGSHVLGRWQVRREFLQSIAAP